MATINLGRIKPVFKGAYSGATAYVIDDIVTSGDETFICILASTGNATSNATYWTKLAAKGTDGTDVGTTITTQGDILYRDGSGLQRLAKPASNKYLQNTSGGVLSWETVTSATPDWEKISNTTISTNTTYVDFETLSTDYQDFKVIISGAEVATNDSRIYMRMKKASGWVESNYEIATRGYDTDNNLYNYNGVKSMYWCTPTGVGNASVDQVHLECVLYDVHNTSNRKLHDTLAVYKKNSADVMYSRAMGQSGVEDAMTGARFFTSNGDWDAGEFTLYGRKIT